jgi:hypothetical protein
MKKLLGVILGIIAAAILLVAGVLVQSVDPSQRQPSVDTYTFEDTLANRHYDVDSLKVVIGKLKGLPTGFEVAAALAYSAFPQLKDVKIDMVLTDDGAPMESTVDIWSLFGPRSNRQYLILLNDARDSYMNPILLRSLPFDAQVGILAHELGHIAYYHKMNILQFGKWGLKYLDDDEFRATHERTTDLMPVYHGLGSQIYQYAYFVRKDSSCAEFYEQGKDFMDKYYLTDEELLDSMK